jgi:uncharacterized protein (DUF58 family)
LVILVTNLRDEDDDTLLPAVRQLRRRHAVSIASLREAGTRRTCSKRRSAISTPR